MIELNQINDEIFKLTEKYDNINSNYVIEPPIITSDKKVKIEEDEEKSEESTDSKKRIKMKK